MSVKRLTGFSLVFSLLTCEQDDPASAFIDAGLSLCGDDHDCAVGERCENSTCIGSTGLTEKYAGGDDPAGAPDIVVTPAELDFGAPQLGEEVELLVEITNAGNALLSVTGLEISEDDATPEFRVDPAAKRAFTVDIGELVQIGVSLRTSDAEVDTGTLTIVSDDPDEPRTRVSLVSELKGTPILCFCALTASGVDPWSPENCTGEEAVRWDGTVYGELATRDVAIWNCAENVDGEMANSALDVASAMMSAETEYSDSFDAWTFMRDTVGAEIATTAPVVLAPVDLVAPETAGVLYVRITFTANDDGGVVPDEVLRITSNNGGEVDATDDFPMLGATEGCPFGTYDRNNDPDDGCESECNPTGEEICDGIDNNCDGIIDDGDNGCGGACDLAGEPGASCDGDDADGCEEGMWICLSPTEVACSDTTGTVIESCNGLDDNCNGYVDEGFSVGSPCDGPDGDLCLEGVFSCIDGAAVCSDSTATITEACNGVDDTCDGSVDEDVPPGAPCDGIDGDSCNEGFLVCRDGVMVCSDVSGTITEACNDRDDDCDGLIDEGVTGEACDGLDADLCREGYFVCSAGVMNCSDRSATNRETCNGLDDDCDDVVDEGAYCAALPEATAVACSGGQCVATACESGFADCDGIAENGCEREMNDETVCPSFDLGSISGDSGADVLTDRYIDEEWDYFELLEDNYSPIYMSATVQLTVPPGLDFDLCCYCYGCAGDEANCSYGLAGVTDVVSIRREDLWGYDDTASYFCHISYYSGDVCGEWGLTVTGNTLVTDTTCF